MEFKSYGPRYSLILLLVTIFTSAWAQQPNLQKELKGCLQFFLKAHELASTNNLKHEDYQRDLHTKCSTFVPRSHHSSGFETNIKNYLKKSLLARVEYDLYQYIYEYRRVLSSVYEQVEHQTEKSNFEYDLYHS
ncbi:MAG: hypothetical protein JNM93_09085, partial [Bacteriovoracaceae bacterium]|nr:hypothetical protein [Bacteriovoracaceae bacterium]